jgi:hypothetical protein
MDTETYIISKQMEKGLAKYPFSNAIKDGIRRYVLHGEPMGDFLMAVFSNNLIETAARADDKNILLLKEYAEFLYEYVPSGCKGSKEIVKNWIMHHRRIGDNRNTPDDLAYDYRTHIL